MSPAVSGFHNFLPDMYARHDLIVESPCLWLVDVISIRFNSGLLELLLAFGFLFPQTGIDCPRLQQIQYHSREAACYKLNATSVLRTYLWASADVTSKASCSRQPSPCRWNSAMPASGSTLAMTLPLWPAQGTTCYHFTKSWFALTIIISTAHYHRRRCCHLASFRSFSFHHRRTDRSAP